MKTCALIIGVSIGLLIVSVATSIYHTHKDLTYIVNRLEQIEFCNLD
jgi:hypothetical protein